MKKAFTLVEILIVIAVLGILAAIAIPTFSGHMQEAKEAAAKDTLRILRGAIDRYAAKYGIAPGYKNNNPKLLLTPLDFYNQIVFQGKYLSKMPDNPINGNPSINLRGNNATFPPEADGTSGWIYQPATKTIRINSPGKDSKGVRYYDY